MKCMENWSRTAVVYQVYPLSFKDSDGDGKGDLRGIIDKLDYLNDGTEKSLGIGAIWISPIYRSPMKDFGYDISDFEDIDPAFGNLKIFDDLIAEAHKRGIMVVMDYVANHTSSEHPWFIESRSSKNSPKRNWYVWKDPKADGSPPNNWLSRFGGPAWTLDKETGQYYLHNFVPGQPDLNWRNEEVQNAMMDVLRFWMDRGVDGFRTDAISRLVEDGEFRDDPPNVNYSPDRDDPYNSLLHIYSEGHPDIPHHINVMCGALGEYDNKFMVSETHYSHLNNISRMYRACANNLHAPFNFNLLRVPWNMDAFKNFIDEYESALRIEDWPNYVLGNHDRSRLASRIGMDRARAAAMLLLTLRGMPFIYYGEEIGMRDASINPSDAKDPWEKNKAGLGLGRDPERTPMQWNAGVNAGFSEAKPWLPVADDYKEYNAEIESADPRSLLNLYRKLIWYRNKSVVLQKGTYRSFDTENDNIFGYVREYDEKKIIVLLNFSGKEQKMSLEDGENSKLIYTTNLDKESGEKIDLKNIKLRANEGYMIEV
jgi:alpha-glucosidase